MKLELINKKDINIELPKNVEKVFLINKNIGYVFLLNTDINKIYIFIKEEYRLNGYAKEVLKEALKYFNEELIFETKNPIVSRLLINSGGINVGNTEGISRIKILSKNS